MEISNGHTYAMSGIPSATGFSPFPTEGVGRWPPAPPKIPQGGPESAPTYI